MRKKLIKNSQPFVKKMKNVGPVRGDFFDSHCRALVYTHWLILAQVMSISGISPAIYAHRPNVFVTVLIRPI